MQNDGVNPGFRWWAEALGPAYAGCGGGVGQGDVMAVLVQLTYRGWLEGSHEGSTEQEWLQAPHLGGV